MLDCVWLVVDGPIRADEVAVLASGLLPKPTAVVVLQVVPQLPSGWAWPALPNAAEGLGRAREYVSEVAISLRALGWNPSARVYFSPLSAAEMDREILRQAEIFCPDLICLALERGSVRAGIAREAAISVLVANPPPPEETVGGRTVESRAEKTPGPAHRAVLSDSAGALAFRGTRMA